MTLRELYESLKSRFGVQSDPDTWWPIFYGRTNPPEFERAITNILVQNSSWKPVQRAVDVMDREGFLTAGALAGASEETLADCAKPTGLQTQKSERLKRLGAFVVGRFGTEADFCSKVSRRELLSIRGIGEETADRILLYTCFRLAWPVDTYCLRVLAHHGVISAMPARPAEKKRMAAAIKQMVEEQMPHQLDDWQRLHALMQLEGEVMRRATRSNAG